MPYAGSAAHYVSGRVPHLRELAHRLAAELGLVHVGRLLDVGCGPGSLTLLLAPLFEHAVGIDADADMLAEAARQAAAAAIIGVDWVCMRAEDLPAGLAAASRQIEQLVLSYLHDQWQAGRGLPRRRTGGDEDQVFRGAGFSGPTIAQVPGRTVQRRSDEIVAGVFSLSSSTPALFGPRRGRFEHRISGAAARSEPLRTISDQMREITFSIYRP
jgi:SAM-dependent methyltransferase